MSERLGGLRPADTSYFAARYAAFDRRLAIAEERWDAMMAPFRGTRVVTYHRSWSNFVERFGLDVVGYVEPKPGIPPSPSHILELVRAMQVRQARLMIVEPYFDLKLPAAIARQAGARVLVLPPSVGGVPEASDYLRLFDYNLNLLVNAIEQARREHHPEPHHHDEHR
jgi:ABC-type Zn uptake system ZnuABC Zn-binding protein ZnuA